MYAGKRITRINIVLFALTVIGGLCFDLVSGDLITKSCASACFVLLGGINLVYGHCRKWKYRSVAWIIMAGLVAGFFADVALEINFIQGAAVFGIGHILYFAAYCFLLPARPSDFVAGAILCVIVIAAMVLLPVFDFGGLFMQVVAIIYAVLISAMWSKAHSNFRKAPCKFTKWLALGSFLFLFSDFALLIARFTAVPDFVSSFCVNTYYPGQAVLACSLLYMDESNTRIS